ncbi:hypothetical protein E2N92_12120 [Methanofollis formosanus]|uniref:Uncharacterized protein n=1 Tax=Methanofollis formosanus TaxID=299308 RepID=A0A8G1A2D7_9EURY|nr:hypothetical protein [Methanofollis formosanus]QYZ80119.1 hypothetical protein E2N92_12120 [Methanofollis formosanus]
MVSYEDVLKKSDLTDFRISSFLKNRTISNIIKSIPFISLFLANLGILLTFECFLPLFTNLYSRIVVYLIGIFLSYVIIKPYLVLNGIQYVKNYSWRVEDGDSHEKRNYFPKIGILTFIVVIIRNFFFNILNDVFIVVIFWNTYLFVAYTFVKYIHFPFNSWIQLSNNFDLGQFISVMTLIGIISGLFQLYILYYQDNVSKKIGNSINRFLSQCLQNIRPLDFVDFLEENKNSNSTAKKIQNFLRNDEDVLAEYLKQSRRINESNGRRDRLNLNLFSLSSPLSMNSITTFGYLDDYAHLKLNEKEKSDLKKFYEDYMDQKHKEFIEEVKNLDLDEIRIFALSNVTFFDESVASYSNLNFETSYRRNHKEGFGDYLTNYAIDCIFSFFDILLNIDIDPSEK